MSDIDDFLDGVEASTRPLPEGRTAELSGETVTTSTSWWHTARCGICGHTFRRGDRVLVDVASRQVWHLDATLGCAAKSNSAGSAGVREFSAGLLAAWPVTGDVPVVSTNDIPSLLAPPAFGFRRPHCLFCAHTFRPGELVVVCPCSPRQRRCGAAVHRDPARGLVCWESWRPDSRVPVCPIMLTRLAH